MSAEMIWLDVLNTVLTIALFLIGLFCLLTRRNAIKLVMGLKILIMGATLSLVSANYIRGDTAVAQALVVSILVVEVVATAVAVALIVNAHRHYGTVDIRHWKEREVSLPKEGQGQ